MVYCWRCKECGAEQDVTRTVAEIEKGPDKCTTEECKSVAFSRTIGKVQFQLVGWGWAAHGYEARGPNYRKGNIFGTD